MALQNSKGLDAVKALAAGQGTPAAQAQQAGNGQAITDALARAAAIGAPASYGQQNVATVNAPIQTAQTFGNSVRGADLAYQNAMKGAATNANSQIGGIMSALQNQLNQQVSSASGTKKMQLLGNLINLMQMQDKMKTQTQEQAGGAVQNKIMNELTAPGDTSLAAPAKSAISSLISGSGDLPTALANLGKIDDNTLGGAGTSRGEVMSILRGYYNPTSTLQPGQTEADIAGVPLNNLLRLGTPADLATTAAANTPQAQTKGKSNLSKIKTFAAAFNKSRFPGS